MYASHFGLSETPFSISPDPRFLYMSKRHREAMAHLLYGIKEGGGFVQLTGEVGTGKTTLCRCLLLQLPENVDVALILNPQISEEELLAMLCDELKIGYPAHATPKILLNVLNKYLLQTYAAGRRAVLVIDEAQLLTRTVLEQVRILTNLETTKQKLLQIILIGQPELSVTLKRSDLTQLAQRITARYHLQALNAQETKEYLKHRLSVVGCHRPLFSNAALRYVYKYSNGIPRLINVLCDRALLGAYATNAQRVSAPIVRKAAKEVLGSTRPQKNRWSWAPALTLMLILAVLLWLPQARQGVVDLVEGIELLHPQKAAPVPDAVEPAHATVTAPPILPDNGETMGTAGNSTQNDQAPTASPEPSATVQPAPQKAAIADKERFIAEQVAFDEPVVAVDSAKVEILATAELDEAQPEVEISRLLSSGPTDFQGVLTDLVGRWQPASLAANIKLDCEQVEQMGLRCLDKTGNWTNLRSYNRAAVLLLRFEGRVVPVLLAGMEGDAATVQIGGMEYSYPVHEIERYWFGKFVLLWRPPPLQNEVIHMASTGPDILWLRQALNRAAQEDGSALVDVTNSAYDEELRKRVLAFQHEHDLDADGLAGADTLIRLNSLLNAPDIPFLVRPPRA